MTLKARMGTEAAQPRVEPLTVVQSPEELIALAEADPAFHDLNARFQACGAFSALYESEKALHYGVGAFAPGNGVVVEIGTWEGASAIFSAGGIERRGTGRLVSVDPHLGGPPWLGQAPVNRTLEKFRKHIKECGVADRIESRLGDSASVAAVWPAEPISAVFIDADHSYLGALRDFESWSAKLLPGGLVLFDDAEDPCLPDLLKLIEDVKGLKGVTYLGLVQGVAVFRREWTPILEFQSEIAWMASARRLPRPWDLAALHRLDLPPQFGKSWNLTESGIYEAYQLSYLARCRAGAYGYTLAASEALKAVVRAVSADRGDGPVVEVTAAAPRVCRVIACSADEVATFAPWLMDGGVCLTRNEGSQDVDATLQVRYQLTGAGLEAGCAGAIHWGIWRPFGLSSETLVQLAYEAYQGDQVG